jgi:hypothetical protein
MTSSSQNQDVPCVAVPFPSTHRDLVKTDFQHQVEAIAVDTFAKKRCVAMVRRLLPSYHSRVVKQPMSLIAGSPYSDYSPSIRGRLVRSSMMVVLCVRLGQVPYPSEPSRMFTILNRVFSIRNFQKEPQSVFFRNYNPLQISFGVWAEIHRGEIVCLDARDDFHGLGNKLNTKRSLLENSTLSVCNSHSDAPLAVYQLLAGCVVRMHGEKSTTNLTGRPFEAWNRSSFGNLRFSNMTSNQGPMFAVMIGERMVFINFETHTATVQKVGSRVTFHPRLPIFWTPASIDERTKKEFPSRLWLIDPSWTRANPVAWGQSDIGKCA